MMLRLLPRNRSDEKYATTDRVMLSDGQVVEVPRANLAAAKALLAAENAAQRRVAREVTARQEPRLPEYAEPLLTGPGRALMAHEGRADLARHIGRIGRMA